MTKKTTPDWTHAYREAYEIAKKGNPVIKTAVARAFFDSDTDVVRFDETFRLVKEATEAGFPPAFWLQGLFAGNHFADAKDVLSPHDCVNKAASLGCVEANCFLAINDFFLKRITAEDLYLALRTNDCVFSMAAVAVKRFIVEAQEKEKAVLNGEGKIAELTQQVASLRTHQQHQGESKKARIRELEERLASQAKTIASLSASSMARDLESLRSELATSKQALAAALTQIAESDLLLETKISDAVEETKKQLMDARLDLEIVTEARDEAIKKADKSDRRMKHLEQLLYKHGINPMEAYAAEEATTSQVPVSDHVQA